MSVKILAFAGSTRSESFNKRLAQFAASTLRQAGADVTYVDLQDYALPLFDEDLEALEGVPENAVKLKHLMLESQGVLISSPEYNGSISGVLKNTLDWISRPVKGKPGSTIAGKVVCLMSASPGGLGGLRGLVHARAILTNLGALVIPNQVAVPSAYEAFTEDATLRDETLANAVRKCTTELLRISSKLNEH